MWNNGRGYIATDGGELIVPETVSSLQPIRVLLADDHDLLRQGLTLLLGLQPDIQVVGEARTGREAVAQVGCLTPDVVVMDISMPDMDGLEACRTIRAQNPTTHVLILTMHDSERSEERRVGKECRSRWSPYH